MLLILALFPENSFSIPYREDFETTAVATCLSLGSFCIPGYDLKNRSLPGDPMSENPSVCLLLSSSCHLPDVCQGHLEGELAFLSIWKVYVTTISYLAPKRKVGYNYRHMMGSNDILNNTESYQALVPPAHHNAGMLI